MPSSAKAELFAGPSAQMSQDNNAFGPQVAAFLAGKATMGIGGISAFLVLCHWLPDTVGKEGHPARTMAISCGMAAHAGEKVIKYPFYASIATAPVTPATPLLLGTAYLLGKMTPAVAVAIGGTWGYNSMKAWNRMFGVEEGAHRAAEEFFNLWRNEWMACLIATQASLLTVYKAFGISVAPAIRRLLFWNNFGVGPDEDVIEVIVIQWPSLASDEVMFEFTALPHITWDKRLRLVTQDGELEELNVAMQGRCVTSRVLHLVQDWPLQMQLQKSSFPGFFKDVHEPWAVPAYPDLGGCIIRVIYVAVKPNNC